MEVIELELFIKEQWLKQHIQERKDLCCGMLMRNLGEEGVRVHRWTFKGNFYGASLREKFFWSITVP